VLNILDGLTNLKKWAEENNLIAIERDIKEKSFTQTKFDTVKFARRDK